MSQNVTIDLGALGIPPILGHKGMITEVVMRPPTYEEYLDIGDIYSYARTPGGNVIPIEDKQAMRAYVGRLLVAPTDELLLLKAPMALGRAMKGAVTSFFLSGSSKGDPSESSEPNSSGEQTSSAPNTSNE